MLKGAMTKDTTHFSFKSPPSKMAFLLWAFWGGAILLALLWRFSIEQTPRPVTTESEAVQVAVDYLEEHRVTVDIDSARILYRDGSWTVSFLRDPPSGFPAHALVEINASTGETRILPTR